MCCVVSAEEKVLNDTDGEGGVIEGDCEDRNESLDTSTEGGGWKEGADTGEPRTEGAKGAGEVGARYRKSAGQETTDAEGAEAKGRKGRGDGEEALYNGTIDTALDNLGGRPIGFSILCFLL